MCSSDMLLFIEEKIGEITLTCQSSTSSSSCSLRCRRDVVSESSRDVGRFATTIAERYRRYYRRRDAFMYFLQVKISTTLFLLDYFKRF